MMCLGVFLLGSNFFGTLWAFWTSWKSLSFARLGKLSFIICLNKFSTSCSCSSSGTPMIRMLEHLKMSQRFLSLSSFFWILYSFHSRWVLLLHFVPNHCFESWFPSFHCWFPVYFPLFHHSPPQYSLNILWPSSVNSVSILTSSVLNSASDRFSISLLLNSFLEFWYVLSFGPYFFVLEQLIGCKGMGP